MFWIAFWSGEYSEPIFDTPLKKSSLAIDHTLPILALLTEHLFINALPIVPRHLSALLSIFIFYLLINLSVSLHTGTSIYPIIDWFTPYGVVMGLISPLIFILTLCVVKW